MPLIERQRRVWERRNSAHTLAALLAKGQETEAQYYASGRLELASVLDFLKRRRLRPHLGLALDFGCGAGRLAQALAAQARKVVGLDISEAVLRLARSRNRHARRCEYRLNVAPDLAIFADRSFDFILTSKVLQHLPPRLAKRYLREFLRVLKPGGLLCFQVPEEGPSIFRRLRRRLRLRTRLKMLAQAFGWMPSANFDPYPVPTYAFHEADLRPFLEGAGGRVLASSWCHSTIRRGLEFTEFPEEDIDFHSKFYVVTKDLPRPLLR